MTISGLPLSAFIPLPLKSFHSDQIAIISDSHFFGKACAFLWQFSGNETERNHTSRRSARG